MHKHLSMRVSGLILALALVVGLVAPVVSAPSAAAMTAPISYHNATPNYHQEQVDYLPSQGYRPISLSISGDPAAPRYAAVWVKRAGPAFTTFSRVVESNLQSFLDGWKSQGYRPAILTAVGPKGSAVFAGVLEATSTTVTVEFGRSTAEFGGDVSSAKKNGWIPRWVTAYGTASAPAFAGVWWANPTPRKAWDVNGPDSSAILGQELNAYASTGDRPELVVPGPAGFTSLWRDDLINGWSVYWNQTSDQLTSLKANQASSNHYPIRIQAFGTGTAARYAAVFAADDGIIGRQWTMTGNNGGMSSFDGYMKQLMTTSGARAGQLAVVRNGKLLYARGFTNAEPGYAATQPTSLFRIASTSKALTSIGIHQIMDAAPTSLAYTSSVQGIMHITQPNGAAPVDSNWNKLTIDHLLRHMSGLPQQPSDLAMVNAYNASLPATPPQWMGVLATEPFDPAHPINTHWYNNSNANLLGQIVAKKRGTTYAAAVTNNVFKTLGLSRPRIGGSLLSQQASGEVRYHPSSAERLIGRSVMSSDQPIVPRQYGSRNIALGEGAGAWIMAAPDWAKVLAAFDRGTANPLFPHNPTGTTANMWTSPDNTGTARGWFLLNLPNASGQQVKAAQHNGGLEGTATLVVHRTDGLSFVLFLNTDTPLYAEVQGVQLNALANKVTAWPTTDLFPSVGIPSF